MSDIAAPPELDTTQGMPHLEAPSETLAEAEPAPAPPTWSPDTIRALLYGVYGVLAALKGPHWALTPEEGEPLVAPHTTLFNSIDFLRQLAPEHVALVTVLLGHAALITKRAAIDKTLAAQRAAASPGPKPASTPSAPPSGSPYGPNRLEVIRRESEGEPQ